MSNINLIIEEHAVEVGNFLVGRLLPFRQKRAVGAFVFVDHMGPYDFTKDQNMDIGPHPHIGLCTLTYLLEGAITHRDSLGTEVDIESGAVNLMVAGRGVVHSERTPKALRNIEKRVHGFQIWIALPKDEEQREPSFYHIGEDELPKWKDGNVEYRLIAGEAFGKKSGVPTFSPLYFIEITATEDTELSIGDYLYGESALYVVEGAVEIEGQNYEGKQLLVNQNAHLCTFTIKEGSKILIFGGEPLAEERFMNWNFVSSDRAFITKAREDWKAQRFDKIPGETGYIPLPEPKF